MHRSNTFLLSGRSRHRADPETDGLDLKQAPGDEWSNYQQTRFGFYEMLLLCFFFLISFLPLSYFLQLNMIASLLSFFSSHTPLLPFSPTSLLEK